MRSIAFPGRFASLNEIREFYTLAAEEADLDEKSIYAVQLAVDEAAANIIDHAYEGEDKGDIECSYRAFPGKLEVVMRDHGKPFNPDDVKEPDHNISIRKRKQRGLGLHFMKSLMDSVEFTFNGHEGNVLKMTKTGKDRTETTNEKKD